MRWATVSRQIQKNVSLIFSHTFLGSYALFGRSPSTFASDSYERVDLWLKTNLSDLLCASDYPWKMNQQKIYIRSNRATAAEVAKVWEALNFLAHSFLLVYYFRQQHYMITMGA